jgi:hypothetical protein
MARTKKKSKSKLIDSGTMAGSMAATAVLAIWLFVELAASNADGEPDTGPDPQPAVVNSGGASAPPNPAPVDTVPAWKKDPRWDKGVKLGKEGIQQAEDAIKWNEEEGGDPFYFGNQIAEAGDKVVQSIRILEDLKKDYPDDELAQDGINKWLKYFERKAPRHKK